MITKNNRETILSSSLLDPLGREVADLLMTDRGLKLESLFNLLGEMQNDILDLRNTVHHLEHDIEILKDEMSALL